MPATNEEFIKKAFEAGLTEDQVRQAVVERNLKLNTTQTNNQSFNPLPFINRNIVQPLARPFIGTGKTIGGAAFELARLTSDKPRGKNENPFLTDEELIAIDRDPFGFLADQAGRSAAIASYAVPITRSNTILGRSIPALGRVKGGALVGALQGAGREVGTDVGARATNIGVGGAFGALIGYLSSKIAGTKKPDIQNQPTGYQDTAVTASEKLGKSKSKSGLAKMGAEITGRQYNVPRSQAQRLRLRETIQELDDYGLRNIEKVRNTVPKVTGDKGIITKVTRESVGQANPVRLDGLIDMADDLSNDPSLPPGVDKKFGEFIKKGVTNLTDTTSKSAHRSQFGDPFKTFNFIQSLEKKAADLTRPRAYSVVQQQDVALSNAYRLMADELKTRLFHESGADDAIVNVVSSPEVMRQLSEISPKLAERARNVTTVGELRSLAAPFVRAGQAIDLTDAGQYLAFNSISDAIKQSGNIISRPLNMIAAPFETNQAKSAIGGLLMRSASAPQIPVPQAPSQVASPAIMKLLLGASLGSRGEQQ